MLTQQVVPISDFRIHQGRTLERMANGPVYLAQRSKPVAVLVAAEQWDQAMLRLQTLEAMLAQHQVEDQSGDVQIETNPSATPSTDFEETIEIVEEKKQANFVTLPKKLLKQIDQFIDGEQDRSEFLATAARSYIIRKRREEQTAREW